MPLSLERAPQSAKNSCHCRFVMSLSFDLIHLEIMFTFIHFRTELQFKFELFKRKYISLDHIYTDSAFILLCLDQGATSRKKLNFDWSYLSRSGWLCSRPKIQRRTVIHRAAAGWAEKSRRRRLGLFRFGELKCATDYRSKKSLWFAGIGHLITR